MVKPIPDGYHTLTPYLILHDGTAMIEFYKKALGAAEVFRMPGPNGKIMHAEMKIGDSMVMMADEYPEMKHLSPKTLGGAGVGHMIYVADCDAAFKQALAAGAEEVMPLKNQFYGDRSGTVRDPSGHLWTIASHVEDVPPEELERRAKEMEKGC